MLSLIVHQEYRLAFGWYLVNSDLDWPCLAAFALGIYRSIVSRCGVQSRRSSTPIQASRHRRKGSIVGL